jgi:hypothetical protein
MILMMRRIDEEDMDAHAQACNRRREVAWSKELPGAWIELEESTALELLVVFGQVERTSFKDIDARRANHGSWFALRGMGLTVLSAIYFRVGRLV